MPRALLNPKTVSIDLGAPPRVTRLRSTPRDEASATPPQLLREKLTPYAPRQDLGRTRFGRALNLDRIEQALRSADFGSMRTLTDLSRETIDTDPHLAAVLGKRFGAVSALPWELVPASGIGVDKDLARFYADVARDQLKQLPNFSQRIHQLAWGLYDGRAAHENQWLLTGAHPGLPAVSHPQYGTVRWMIRDLLWIHPRRLQFGPQRELRLNDNFDGGNFSQTGISLDDPNLRHKFIQFMPQLFGDYQEREGLARRCLYWSFFKRSSARERMMLMELFGKPWRWLEVDEESTADSDDLEQADEMLQQLGGSASFRFPRGTKLNVQQPGKGAGEVHQAIIEESDKQLSKLVLGQTGTTDANPAGLNNVQANVMQDEQFMLLMRDSRLISEVIETYLTDAIIELNFGPDAVTHAPHFVLRADVPLDRTKELTRLKAALDAGLEVATVEAYEISGFRQPRTDEAVLKIETPPAHPLAVQPDPARAQIVYPAGFTLPAREVQPIAAPGAGGLPPPAAPAAPPALPPASGGPAPDDNTPARTDAPTLHTRRGSRDLAVELARAKDAALAMETGNIVVTLANAHPSDAAAIRNTFLALALAERGISHINLDGTEDEDDEDIDPEEEVRRAMQPVEKGQLGSVETVIVRGAREGARASELMAKTFVDAVAGLTTGPTIMAALERAAEEQNMQPFTRSIERRLMQGTMTGGLAAHFEILEDKDLPALTLASGKSFTERPYSEASRWFQSLNVVNKNTYNRLDASAKRRAFTIANVHNQRQLELAKEELKRALEKGVQLRDFSAQLNDRFALAGMTTLNPSHVETVYRTNVVNAYNSGRHAQMTQPAMLRARPYWRISTVNDGPPRQRATHQAVHNWVIRADDTIWTRAFPPFGFNCRCRVGSVSQADVDNKGLAVRSGSEIKGLPDPGFTAGTSTLL